MNACSRTGRRRDVRRRLIRGLLAVWILMSSVIYYRQYGRRAVSFVLRSLGGS